MKKYVYKVQATLSLGDKFSTEVEKVGGRAFSFGNTRCKSIKTILEQGISDAYDEPHSPTIAFIRSLNDRKKRSGSTDHIRFGIRGIQTEKALNEFLFRVCCSKSKTSH
ncbi:MAG TPA: hypothetical protein PKM17_09130 [Syntrophorhabdus sp.]|nr:hypothetical protein [Syntrophorhabdus sp.]